VHDGQSAGVVRICLNDSASPLSEALQKCWSPSEVRGRLERSQRLIGGEKTRS